MIGKTLMFAAKIVFGLFLLMLLFDLLPGAALFKMVFALGFGWIQFIGRVLPEASFNPAAIGMVVICSGLFLWGTQRFCSWLFGSFRSQASTGSAWPSAWPWRWSVGIYCGLWLLFLTSMSVTGMAHQIGWLVRSDKPIVENRRPRERWEIGAVARHLDAKCGQSGWDGHAVRAACDEAIKSNSARRDDALNERWHVVFIERPAGAIQAVFIAYRDAELRSKYGYYRVTPTGVTNGPIYHVAEDIRTFAAKIETPTN